MRDSVRTCLRQAQLSAVLVAVFAGCLNAQEPAAGGRGGRGGGGGGMLAQAGSSDKQVVDEAAAQRGQTIYAAECITCHGASARGAQNGPDLVRSVTVLHDRYGDQIGALLKKGHPTQTRKTASFSVAEITDLSHFIHLKVNDTMRTSPLFHAQNVLTGDAKAGEAYFNGDGKCNQCHSATGNLKGIGAKYEPIALQDKFISPRIGGGGRGRGAPNATTRTVKVTPPSGPAVSGTLLAVSDFAVTLREADGSRRTFTREGDTPKVEIMDPLQAHLDLLRRITDRDIHNLTAYMVSLK